MSLEIPQFARTGIDIAARRIVHPYLTRGEAQTDREVAHTRALDLMEAMQKNPDVMRLLKEMFVFEDPILQTEFAGLSLPNPLSIEAGFDKTIRVHRLLGEALGFGVVKVGTVTKIPYEGNPQPRIFDLPLSDGLINRMGFPGDGTNEAESRLREDNSRKRKNALIISVAASRISFDRGHQVTDFIDAALQMRKYGDGIEGNVSSPNTRGVTGLQQTEVFQDLSAGVREVLTPNGTKVKLIIYKYSPDLDQDTREKVATIAIDNGADALTYGNITTDPQIRAGLANDTHREEMGGISGRPLKERALEISHNMYSYLGEGTPISFAGGIANAEDVWNALTYGGARIVGVYSAFVRPNTFTPNFAFYVLRDLAKAMRMARMSSMQDFKDLRGKKVPYPLKG
ncbi:MAG: dihydroorotate dehydrogenase 2 [Candidatus Levybacteria bacterium]|nr:dihydroorotate dehydrogenase 2 [Candidatus Levybacteria bacterium]